MGDQTRAPDECLEDPLLLKLDARLDRLEFDRLLDDEELEFDREDLEDILEDEAMLDEVDTRENRLTKGRPRAVLAGPGIHVSFGSFSN